MSSNRLFIGNRIAFIPTGPVVHIGPKPKNRPGGLGEIQEIGLAKQITIVIGQNKGLAPKNQKGSCARKPTSFNPPAVDRAFEQMRAFQVGRDGVNASRQAGRGWYQGDAENSMRYEMAYIPNDREKTFAQFKKNVNHLAENIAEEFCQDSVLIIREDGTKKTIAFAEWDEQKKPKAKKQKRKK